MNNNIHTIVNDARSGSTNHICKLSRAALANNLTSRGFTRKQIADYLDIIANGTAK